jgi:hypothetical protein
MFNVIEEDVGAFVDELAKIDVEHGSGRGGSMQAVRLAVTRKQADDMELPTAPKNTDDSRAVNFEGETVQCEAIPPDTLNAIVREAITSRLDMKTYRALLAMERKERARIEDAIKDLAFEETAT